MRTETLRNWTLAAVGVCAFLAIGALLDGPTEAEIEEATAAELLAAYAAEQDALQRLAKCRALRGPSAEVVLHGINGQEFFCRVNGGY